METHIENLLENKTRRAIYDAIKAEPGITQSEIAHSIKAHMTCVVYHLRIFEHHKVIVSKANGHRHYFINGGLVDPKHKDIIIGLRPKTAFKIVEMLAKDGPSFPKDISLEIDVPPGTISWHLKQLVKRGVIASLHEPENARLCKYALTEAKLVQSVIDEYPNLKLRKSA